MSSSPMVRSGTDLGSESCCRMRIVLDKERREGGRLAQPDAEQTSKTGNVRMSMLV